MSEVPHAIPDCFQPLLQRVLRYTHGSILVGGIDSVLRLRETRRLESMEVERIEDLQGFESGSPARLRHVGRNCARTPSQAECAACLSPERLTLKPQVGSAPASVLSNPVFAALKRWPRGAKQLPRRCPPVTPSDALGFVADHKVHFLFRSAAQFRSQESWHQHQYAHGEDNNWGQDLQVQGRPFLNLVASWVKANGVL
jgi:hypothetical protein